jgi:membrane associated rhomboid family serine protease
MILDKIRKRQQKSKVLTNIIIINVAVFVIFNLLLSVFFISGGSSCSSIGCSLKALEYIALPTHFGSFLSKPWTIFTNMFAHTGFFHILFNMLWLYWMGKILRTMISDDQLLRFYLLGGLSGNILLLLIYNGFNVPGGHALCIGASAAVMAIIVGAGTMAPNHYINMLFIGPVKLKWIAIASFFLFCIFDLSSNTGGKIAHLGGATFGFLYAKNLLKQPASVHAQQQKEVAKRREQTRTDDGYRQHRSNKKEEINVLLEKISKKGYDSLSSKEKKRLEFLSKN